MLWLSGLTVRMLSTAFYFVVDVNPRWLGTCWSDMVISVASGSPVASCGRVMFGTANEDR